MKIYVVQSGDNVDAIAQQFQIPVDVLIYDNQIEYPYRLAVGQALLINDGQDEDNKVPLYVSGYAYPFINPQTLNETLPWLSDLNVFSYGFTQDGDLVYPMSDDTWMVDAIVQGDVRPILTLAPLDASGMFNNNLITALVSNPEAQWRLIYQMREVILEKGYGGVSVDFEYVIAEDRDGLAAFVDLLTETMNQWGYEVTVALAPKTSRDQPGLLYEGIDYQQLGAAANRAMLMTYEWGYTYGPPMAVAPLNMVRRVVDYAVSEIPREKLILGIPNYGYVWQLPYERGVTKARTISNLEAIQIAIEHGAAIQFDETAMSPYFRYWDDGIEYEVWFEDVRSLQAKFELIKEYGLSGVGYWQLMQYFRPNWLLLDSMFYLDGLSLSG